MNQQKLTPEKSFEIITQVIAEAKSKFEEDGLIYMMWGILLFFAAVGQFLLLRNGNIEINYYPYFIIPFGVIASWIYYARKKQSTSNQINNTISITWGIIALNLMVLGFLFSPIMKENLIPINLILMGIGTITSGKIINSQLILFAGVFLNIAGFICFYLEWIYHPLLLGISSLLFIFVPGLIIQIKKK